MNKLMKKVMVSVIAFAMILGMCVDGFADTQTGTLNINNTISAKDVELYRIFSATKADNDAIAYTLETAFETYFSSEVPECVGKTGTALSESAYEYMEAIETDTKRVEFAKNVSEWIDNLTDKSAIDALKTDVKTTADTTTVTDLEYGFYLARRIEGTDKAYMLVNITDTEVEVDMKNVYPTVDKKVVMNDKDADVGSAMIGDEVTFKLNSSVPDMSGYDAYTFKFKDTLSEGLTFGEIKSVTIGNKNLTEGTGSNTYTLTQTKVGTETEIVIELNNFIENKDDKEKEIVVTYTATLNKNAKTGLDPNTNKAVVNYSTDPTTAGKPGEMTGTSTTDIVNLYSFDFTILKQDPDENPLADAEFKLYTDEACENEIKLIALEDGGYEYRVLVEADATTEGVSVVTNNEGLVKINGLKEGVYYLKETKAPTGYNNLIVPVKVTITPIYEDDEIKSVNVNYTLNGTSTDVTITDKNDSAQIPVINRKGAQLPSTGGMGTIIFTVIGVIIIAIMITSSIISKKRKKAN